MLTELVSVLGAGAIAIPHGALKLMRKDASGLLEAKAGSRSCPCPLDVGQSCGFTPNLHIAQTPEHTSSYPLSPTCLHWACSTSLLSFLCIGLPPFQRRTPVESSAARSVASLNAPSRQQEKPTVTRSHEPEHV